MSRFNDFSLINKQVIKDKSKIENLLLKLNIEKDIKSLFVNFIDKDVCFNDYNIINSVKDILVLKDIESQKIHINFLFNAFSNDFLNEKQSFKYNLIKKRFSYKRKNQKYLINIDEELNRIIYIGYYVYKADIANVFNTEYLFYWCLLEKK